MAAILNNVRLMQETSVVHPHRTTAYHGETVNFSIDFRSYGAQVDLTGATAALYWRVPSDEEGYWHQGEASCSGSTATWAWDASMDNGEGPVTWFLKVDADDSNDTTSYRATGELKLLASPGFTPAVIPPAHATLDFDLINVLHAPYYTQAETDTAIANAIADIPPPAYPVVSVNGKTGAVTLTASDVGAATTQYVNTGLAGKLDKSGGTVTGGLTCTAGLNAYSPVTFTDGGMLAGTFSLNSSPIANTDYVDTAIANAVGTINNALDIINGEVI